MTTKATHLKTGLKGERMAVAELRRLGMEILARNFTFQNIGEIDIVARDGGVLCFVEVKTRHQKSGAPFSPADAVTSKKRDRLRKTAHAYLTKHNLKHLTWRYDIMEIYLGKWFWQHQRNLLIDVFNDHK